MSPGWPTHTACLTNYPCISPSGPDLVAWQWSVLQLQSSSFFLTSCRMFGLRSPSTNASNGCSTSCSAMGRCKSAAAAGCSRESRSRPRTISPSGKMSEVSLRGSPTPRTSSYSSRRWSWRGGRWISLGLCLNMCRSVLLAQSSPNTWSWRISLLCEVELCVCVCVLKQFTCWQVSVLSDCLYLTMISREPFWMLPPPWERSVTTVSWSTSSCKEIWI